MTDPANQTTQFTYDGNGLMATMNEVDGGFSVAITTGLGVQSTYQTATDATGPLAG